MSDVITLANQIAAEKENIRQAIENRGVNIPASTPLTDYAAKIAAINTENVATDVYNRGDQDDTNPTLTIAGNYGTISPNALSQNNTLTSVDLNYVSTVGNHAFEGDTNLTNITGDHLKYVGDSAFKNTGLTSLTNQHIEYIGDSAFSNCSSLATVNIKAKLASSAFCYNDSLTSFTSSDVVIPNNCCRSCGNLQTISAPNAKKIAPFAFYYVGMERYLANNENTLSVVLPEAEVLDFCSFADCCNIVSFSAPKVKHVCSGALGGYAIYIQIQIAMHIN